MRALKDSGNEWLDELPEDWESFRLDSIFLNSRKKNVDRGIESYLSLMANIGVIPFAEKGNVGNKPPGDFSNCKVALKGDFIVNSMNFGIGSFGIAPQDGILSPVYFVLRRTNPLLDDAFLSYVFRVGKFREFAQMLGSGILEHRSAIPWDKFKGVRIAAPNKSEQRVIAQYLDQETSKIDLLISKKEQLIEKLLELRQAVIDRAMSNQNPLLSDGSETASKVKYLATLNPSANNTSSATRDEEASFVPMALISEDGKMDASKGRPFRELVGKYSYFREGDVLLAKVTPCFENGKAATAMGTLNGHGFATTEVTVFSPKDDRVLDSSFLLYVLLQTSVREEGKSQMTGAGGLRRVPEAVLENTDLLLPDLSSQKKIVESIERKLRLIDDLALKAKTAIKLLQERRQSLITQVVTGKLDVRGLVNGDS